MGLSENSNPRVKIENESGKSSEFLSHISSILALLRYSRPAKIQADEFSDSPIMKSGMKQLQAPHVSWREIPDQISFILAFALGALGSLYLKSSNVDLPIAAAVFAGLIILLYALMAGISGRLKFEPEAIGDNCYYLGFLITLSSLAYTLYQVDAAETATGDEGTGDIIPEVISGFGVALSSTIFGVFLRVLFMRLRPDPENRDQELRAEINRSFRELKKSISGMLSQMKKFSEDSVKLASAGSAHSDVYREIRPRSSEVARDQLRFSVRSYEGDVLWVGPSYVS